jgi:hypothetical protein
MERHHSFGDASAGSLGPRPREGKGRELELEARGNVINFPGNLRFRPMEDRREMLSMLALLVTQMGSLGLRSSEELKDIIFQHFGISKHELYVYRSHSDPFLVLFLDRHSREVVFVVGGVIDGPCYRFLHWQDLPALEEVDKEVLVQ